MLVNKAYKYRIYPTETQKVFFTKQFGCSRFIYNHCLTERKKQYEQTKKSDNYVKQCKTLTKLKKNPEYSWLNEVCCQSLQSSIKNLDIAYKNFFKKQNDYPRFKSKNDDQSFKVPQYFKLKDGKLHIPKVKEGIKILLDKRLKSVQKICFITISKTKTGKYFASLTCEVHHVPLPKTGTSIGIDTGINHLAVLSDGTEYGNHKFLRSKLKKVKFNNRQLSKKKKGSNNRNKQRIKLARVHEKVKNLRLHHLHQVTTEIIKNHDEIYVENLAVKNLLKNRYLGMSFNDVALGMFYQMLEYKAKWNERKLVKINRFFPSSKNCSSCGFKNNDLKLSERVWVCESCGTTHNRDLNAAKNILNEGLKSSGCNPQSDVKQKQGEALALAKSATLGVPMKEQHLCKQMAL
jgi:putative transposase